MGLASTEAAAPVFCDKLPVSENGEKKLQAKKIGKNCKFTSNPWIERQSSPQKKCLHWKLGFPARYPLAMGHQAKFDQNFDLVCPMFDQHSAKPHISHSDSDDQNTTDSIRVLLLPHPRFLADFPDLGLSRVPTTS